MSKPLLLAEAVHKSFPMGRTVLHVLRDCSLQVQSGEFVAIMGKSGSGKSTLLHILGALDVPQRGEVYLSGQPLCRPRESFAAAAAWADHVYGLVQRAVILLLKCLVVLAFFVILVVSALLLAVPALAERFTGLLALHQIAAGWALLALLALLIVLVLLVLLPRLALVEIAERRRTIRRRRDIGFVFQFYHLLPELNVLENVLLPRMVDSLMFAWPARRGQARHAALQTLQRVGLAERLKHKPNELSGGECQRVAMARALVHRPRILFADEPTGNLDAEAGANIMALLKELHREGQTIVMVTHDPSIAQHADRVLRLEAGRLRPA